MTADEIIQSLGLEPHPEGGHFRQTWIAPAKFNTRATGTAIYYLLKAGERSHWHKVDATEIWHFYAGAPLTLRQSVTELGPATVHIVGANLAAGERPQVIVAENHWQSAATMGAWTLVGCTVSPAFRFDGFTLAAPGFDIPD
ncbi:MAG: cupin domain-containing protein [Pseudomonadota bacterium]